MKLAWRVKLDGKGSCVINKEPISREELLRELNKNWKNVEVYDARTDRQQGKKR